METQKTDRLERLMDTYGTQIKRFCALQLKDDLYFSVQTF